MSVRHFENGKDVSMQHVNTAVKINNIINDWIIDTDHTIIYSVPTNKKWTIYKIGAFRKNAGDIKIYIRHDSALEWVLLDSDLVDGAIPGSGKKVIIESPFTISYGFQIAIQFYTGVSELLYWHILHSEEAE